MLRIRLFRTGKKHQPSYKIVVVDKNRAPRGGRFVDELGFLNPKTKEKSINEERAKYWISQGAQPSDTVHNLFVREGIIKAPKIDVHKKSKKKPAEEAKPSASVKTSADKEEKPAEEPKKEIKEIKEIKEEPKSEEKPAEEKTEKPTENQNIDKKT